MRLCVVAAVLILAQPAYGQAISSPQHNIDVTGHGRVSVPPDTVNIHYWLRGEGKTPDEATRAIVDSQKRVESGLKSFLGADAEITNSDLLVIEVRDPNCKRGPGQGALTEDQCAVVGYLASSQADVRTRSVAKAGTTVSLASHLGASDVRLQGFELGDIRAARAQAMGRAVSDALAQAQVLAAAAGGHVGRAVDIRYGSFGVFYEQIPTVGAPPPPPPAPHPAPVEIAMNPRPQEITADVSVTYELLP